MKQFLAPALLVLCAAPLAACGGDGDDRLAEQVEDNAEDQADAMEANGATDAQADAVEDVGEQRGEAIDDSDVDTDDLPNTQRDAMTNGN